MASTLFCPLLIVGAPSIFSLSHQSRSTNQETLPLIKCTLQFIWVPEETWKILWIKNRGLNLIIEIRESQSWVPTITLQARRDHSKTHHSWRGWKTVRSRKGLSLTLCALKSALKRFSRTPNIQSSHLVPIAWWPIALCMPITNRTQCIWQWVRPRLCNGWTKKNAWHKNSSTTLNLKWPRLLDDQSSLKWLSKWTEKSIRCSPGKETARWRYLTWRDAWHVNKGTKKLPKCRKPANTWIKEAWGILAEKKT